MVARLKAAIDFCQDPIGHPDRAADDMVLVDIGAVFMAGRPFDDGDEPPIARDHRRQ